MVVPLKVSPALPWASQVSDPCNNENGGAKREDAEAKERCDGADADASQKRKSGEQADEAGVVKKAKIEQDEGQAANDEEDNEKSEANVKEGDRIEVLWELDDEPMWWSATIHPILDGTADFVDSCGTKRTIWELKYEECEKGGEEWPEETQRVCFVNSEDLFEVEGENKQVIMKWQPESYISGKEIVQIWDEQDREDGFDAAKVEEDTLKSLPANIAAKVANGYRQFCDAIKSSMGRYLPVEANGEAVEITGSDMQAILSDAMKSIGKK